MSIPLLSIRRTMLPVFALFAGVLSAHGPMSTSVSEAEDVVMRDRVEADLVTPATRRSTVVYNRVVTREKDNTFRADITDLNGMPRMTGTYKDAALKVPDGEFIYYYANGRVESTGTYVNGMKRGTWRCWQSDGAPRADRIYLGQDWDHLQVSLGLAERAATVGTGGPTPNRVELAPDPEAMRDAPAVRSLPSKSKIPFWKRHSTRNQPQGPRGRQQTK